MTSTAAIRLADDRKYWRQDPLLNFFAYPTKNVDGTINLMKWNCGIPGLKGTNWEKGFYKIYVFFSEEYPAKAPKVKFLPPILHPNVHPSGTMILPFLTWCWTPDITIKHLLLELQDTLNFPDCGYRANTVAYVLYTTDRKEYERRVVIQAIKMRRID